MKDLKESLDKAHFGNMAQLKTWLDEHGFDTSFMVETPGELISSAPELDSLLKQMADNVNHFSNLIDDDLCASPNDSFFYDYLKNGGFISVDHHSAFELIKDFGHLLPYEVDFSELNNDLLIDAGEDIIATRYIEKVKICLYDGLIARTFSNFFAYPPEDMIQFPTFEVDGLPATRTFSHDFMVSFLDRADPSWAAKVRSIRDEFWEGRRFEDAVVTKLRSLHTNIIDTFNAKVEDSALREEFVKKVDEAMFDMSNDIFDPYSFYASPNDDTSTSKILEAINDRR